ncbi:unnamed protein product [Choristocarpus tenellus]
MASSALRRQVDALRHAAAGTPSAYLQRKKGKPSLLLSPDQAAEVDLSSVREAALSGLQRLEALNHLFSPYKDTLFSKESEGTLRELQTRDDNKKIDASLEAFLRLLSPHFASREAHLVMEYLVRHYKVYQYNVDAVMECCLPWHDTKACARMIQLLSIGGTRWEFLGPVQLKGVPLPRQAIAERCHKDQRLLRFLCNSARQTAEAVTSSIASDVMFTTAATTTPAVTEGRGKIFSFFAATVVESFGLGTSGVSESTLRSLLPTVLDGLGSTHCPEFQMSAYMILAMVAERGSLAPEVLGATMKSLLCRPCQGGMEPPLLCAIAVMQSQAGNFSNKLLPQIVPNAALKKMCRMEGLVGVLAGLAGSYDASAFLWAVVQRVVENLGYGEPFLDFLLRLSSYPHWPSSSFPRLVRRLIDSMLKVYLRAVSEDERDAAMEVSEKKEIEISTLERGCQQVLRSLCQRYPADLDAQVSKVSKLVKKRLAEEKKGQEEGGDDEDGDGGGSSNTRKGTARVQWEALMSLLTSSFSVTGMAHHLPLMEMTREEICESVEGSMEAATDGVNNKKSVTEDNLEHTSISVAVEHPLGTVRVQALLQLEKALRQGSTVANTGEGEKQGLLDKRSARREMVPSLLRRLRDEDPEVLFALLGSEFLTQQVLLGKPDVVEDDVDMGMESRESVTSGEGNGEGSLLEVSATVAGAALPWIASLSEDRPRYSHGVTARVLTEFVQLSASAVMWCSTTTGESPNDLESRSVEDEGTSLNLRFFPLLLECVPGPHNLVRARCAGVDAEGRDGRSKEEIRASKAKRRAVVSLGREALSIAKEVWGRTVGWPLGRALLESLASVEFVGEHAGAVDAKAKGEKGENSAVKSADGAEKKTIGMKALSEGVCDKLADALGSVSSDEGDLKILWKHCGPGARWLLLEAGSRAIKKSCEHTKAGKEGSALSIAVADLVTMSLSSSGVRRGQDMYGEREASSSASTPGHQPSPSPAVLLGYLRGVAPGLPRPERPFSLFPGDHLGVVRDVNGGVEELTAGAILLMLLEAMDETGREKKGAETEGSIVAWEGAGSILLNCYEMRPLPVLAALTLGSLYTTPTPSQDVGVESNDNTPVLIKNSHHNRGWRGDKSTSKSREESSREGVDKAETSASKSLCVASTFIKAAAEASSTVGGDGVREDIVGMFPVVLLALLSDRKCTRNAGLLLASTLAEYGELLTKKSPSASATSPRSSKKKKSPGKRKGKDALRTTGGPELQEENLMPIAPLASSSSSLERSGKKLDGKEFKPASLRAPSLLVVVELCKGLVQAKAELVLHGRHLEQVLRLELVPGGKGGIGDKDGEVLVTYLVAWASRLGRREPKMAAVLLSCLRWSEGIMRRCCSSLLRHCLALENERNHESNVGTSAISIAAKEGCAHLLRLLLELFCSSGTDISTTVEGSDGLHKKKKRKVCGESNGRRVKEESKKGGQAEGRALFIEALRTPGLAQELALVAVANSAVSAMGAVGEKYVHRTVFFMTILEVSLGGTERWRIVNALGGLGVTPQEFSRVVNALVMSGCGTTHPKKTDSAKERVVRRRKRRLDAQEEDTRTGQGVTPSKGGEDKEIPVRVLLDATSKDWAVALSGVMELVQALSNASDRSTGDKQSLEPKTKWKNQSWALVRPLFSAILPLLSASLGPEASSDDPVAGTAVDVSAAEYCLWLTIDSLEMILRRGVGWSRGKGLYDETRAGYDAEAVVQCIRDNPSPQTRNSGLLLLARMTQLFPAEMAVGLPVLLDVLGASAVAEASGGVRGSDGEGSVRLTQQAVRTIVPALKEHGKKSGVGAQYVVEVFVRVLDSTPVHSKTPLFGTLVGSLGEDCLHIVTTLLLCKAAKDEVTNMAGELKDGGGGGRSQLKKDEVRTVEFAHHTCHCAEPRSQVNALVGLVQACHRLCLGVARREGKVDLEVIKKAMRVFVAPEGLGADNGEEGLLVVPLSNSAYDGCEGNADENGAGFMSLDVGPVLDLGEGVSGVFLKVCMEFLVNHLVSKPLLHRIAAADVSDGRRGKGSSVGMDVSKTQRGFLLLCEELLLLLKTLSFFEQAGGESSSKLAVDWTQLRLTAYDVLDTLQSLFSIPSFIVVTQELLQHEDAHVRRKALEMFTRRLDPSHQHDPSSGGVVKGGSASLAPLRLSPEEEFLFLDMLPDTKRVAAGRGRKVLGSTEGVNSFNGDDDMSDVQGQMEESLLNRQTALLSLDVLARSLGRRHPKAFVSVLDVVTVIVEEGGHHLAQGDTSASPEATPTSAPLTSSAFLVLATLCAVLGPRAFPCLPRFFPAMLHALEVSQDVTVTKSKGKRASSLLETSALSAVATVAASLPTFLSPYLVRILVVTLQCRQGAGNQPGGSIRQACDRVATLVAAGVESRLLVPAMCKSYDSLLVEKEGKDVVQSVARLMLYIREVVTGLSRDAVAEALPQLTNLIMRALDFRRVYASNIARSRGLEGADLVDSEAAESLVAVVMHLSEAQMRPVFLRLCEWKSMAGGLGEGEGSELNGLDRRLSFYRVLESLSAGLKSIFTPYFAHVLEDCREDLEAASSMGEEHSESRRKVNQDGAPQKKEGKRKRAGKSRGESEDMDMSESEDGSRSVDGAGSIGESWHRRMDMTRLIISSLHQCFLFDREGFVNKVRFDSVMPALVAHLECHAAQQETVPSDGSSSLFSRGKRKVAVCRDFAEKCLAPCMAQLAAAVGKDAMWKGLVNAIMLRSRSDVAGVRVAALVCLHQCFEVVGEEFLALLPECIPFLSELLEDGDPDVERECRRLVKYIEGVLGESIESYLS